MGWHVSPWPLFIPEVLQKEKNPTLQGYVPSYTSIYTWKGLHIPAPTNKDLELNLGEHKNKGLPTILFLKTDSWAIRTHYMES